MSIAKVLTAQPGALKAQLVNVETDVSVGLYNFLITGLPNKEVDEAKDRVAAAIKNSGIPSPKSENRKIVTSLSPAHIKKEGTHFDLPIAVSYLKATGQINLDGDENFSENIFVGELSLSGEVLAVTGVLSIAMLAKESGIKNIFVPEQNKEEAALVDNLNIYPVKNLRQLIDFFDEYAEYNNNGRRSAPAGGKVAKFESTLISKQKYLENIETEEEINTDLFEFVKGQELAKRALLIAAAGGHNVALYGPPGTGKTMLAKAFSGILPPLTREAMLEVTSIHSFAGVLSEDLITKPPFRSPHHTASNAALIGGGANMRPGEITLAHRGVLFLDEFPEFDRSTVESLRQPLEDGEVVVSRAKGTVKYPARVTLVAALNPCPCGFRGSQVKECKCKDFDVERYERKISGPIIDRIDLWVEVPHIPYEEFKQKNISNLNKSINTKPAQDLKSKVKEVRAIQQKRYGKDLLNAHIKAKEIEEFVKLSTEAEQILIDYAKKFSLSPRSFHRMKKIARTIADISNTQNVEIPHILEAFQYRPKMRD
jgi:magnesium chelatase family protein